MAPHRRDYRHVRGFNLRAIGTTLAGALIALAGMFWEPMHPIYNWSWFVGFGVAGGLYWLLMLGAGQGTRGGIPAADIAPPR